MNSRALLNPPKLPEDVFHEIFLHLSVKTLTRFRCVSKEWNRIITSLTFANWHYMSSNKRRRDDHLFMHSSTPKYNLVHYNVADCIKSVQSLNKIGNSRIFSRLLRTNYKLSLPIIQSNNFELFGSSSTCRGLLCVLFADHRRDTSFILVMNPFTRQSREVQWPEPNIWEKQHVYWRYTAFNVFVGFGYDRTTDDYKIVVNTLSAMANSIHVMSLRSNNVWRSIEDGKSCVWGRRKSKPVTIDGDIYWITVTSNDSTRGGHYAICKFNVTDERAEILPCPPDKYLANSVQLGQYEGSLCFFCYNVHRLYGYGQYWGHVFKLSKDDDNGEATWINVMDIPLLPLLVTDVEKTVCGFTNNGDLIIYSSQYSGLLVYLAKENRLVSFPLGYAVSSRGCSLNLDETFHLFPIETLFSPLL